MKLSIIVPIYNVAPYLKKCVDSLLQQDISDYEIILVDDGSTDDSGIIADEIVREAICNRQWTIGDATDQQSQITNRPIISVIHQENAGLSAARNAGIAKAKGEYIWFVDSDDYVEPNVLGVLLEQIECDNLDVLRCRYQNVNERGEVFAPYKDMTNYNDYSANPTDGITFLNNRMGNQCYAVQFIIRKEIALQELFTRGIYFEDTDWTPRMLLRAKRVASTNLIVYNYLWREGSITLSQKDLQKQRKQLIDKINLLNKLNTWGNQVPDRRWFDGMISGLMVNVIGIVASTYYVERKEYLQQIKAMHLLPLSTYHIAQRAQRKVKLINMSIDLAVRLLYLKEKKEKL